MHPQRLLWVLSALMLSPCRAQAPQDATAKPTPEARISQAKDRFATEMARLRQDTVLAYSAKIEALRNKKSDEQSRKLIESLKDDLEKFRASETRSPSVVEMKDATKKLEAGAKTARVTLRKEIEAAAAELKKAKQHEAAEAALSDLEKLAPNCINVASFASKMKDHRDKMIAQIIQGNANRTSSQIREQLDAMVTAAAAGTVSAFDLTQQSKTLIETIDGCQAVKSGKGKHKDILEDAAAAIRVLMAVKE